MQRYSIYVIGTNKTLMTTGIADKSYIMHVSILQIILYVVVVIIFYIQYINTTQCFLNAFKLC